MLTALLLVAVAPRNLAMDDIKPEALRATVEKLASFTTRNTLSPTLNEAAAWLADEYRKIPGVQVELMKYTVLKGRRIPEDKEVVQVVATLPGKTDQRIVIGGHLDSLNLQSMRRPDALLGPTTTPAGSPSPSKRRGRWRARSERTRSSSSGSRAKSRAFWVRAPLLIEP